MVSIAQSLVNPTPQPVTQCGNGVPTADYIHYVTADISKVGSLQLTESAALAMATQDTFVKDQLPAPEVKVQLVLYSNDVKGVATTPGNDEEADKNLLYQQVPAWIVTFCGVKVMPISRPALPDSSQYGKITLEWNQWNYVIDARTGKYIEEFASR